MPPEGHSKWVKDTYGITASSITFKHVKEHIEVYHHNTFLFSADNEFEAMRELEEM